MEGQTVIAPDVDPGLDLDPDPGFDLDLGFDPGLDLVPDLGFDPDLGPGIGLYPDLYLVQVFVPGIDPYPVPVPVPDLGLGLGQMFDPVLAQYL